MLLPFVETHHRLHSRTEGTLPSSAKGMLCCIMIKLNKGTGKGHSIATTQTEPCADTVLNPAQNLTSCSLPDAIQQNPDTIKNISGDFAWNRLPENVEGSKNENRKIAENKIVPIAIVPNVRQPPNMEDNVLGVLSNAPSENLGAENLGSKNNSRLLNILSDPLEESIVKKLCSRKGIKLKLCDENQIQEPNERIPCPQCDTTFSRLKYLKDHIKRKHETYECRICGDTSFNSQKGVDRHVKRVHVQQEILESLVCTDSSEPPTRTLHNTIQNLARYSLTDSTQCKPDVFEHESPEVETDRIPDEIAWDSLPGNSKASRNENKVVPVALIPNTHRQLQLDHIKSEAQRLLSNQLLEENATENSGSSNNINREIHVCTESPTKEANEKNLKGAGTMPSPHCGTAFLNLGNLRDHVKRRHETCECPLCGDNNFESDKDVERHLRRVYIKEEIDENTTCADTSNNSEPITNICSAQSTDSCCSLTDQRQENTDAYQNDSPDFDMGKTPSDITRTSLQESKYENKVYPIAIISNKQQSAHIKAEVLDQSLEEGVAESKKKKPRGSGTIPCPRCNTTFSKVRYLKEHIKRKHETFECKICGDKSFYSDKGVERHVQKVHMQQKTFESVVCDNKSNNSKPHIHTLPNAAQNPVSYLSPVVAQENPAFQNDSSDCEVDFIAEEIANNSLQDSKKENEAFPIAILPNEQQTGHIKAEVLDQSLEEGVTEPKKKKPRGSGTIPCPQCNTTFSKVRYLKDHIKRKHETFECQICGDTSFNSHKGVERHVERVHMQQDMYECHICGDKGSSLDKKGLQKHLEEAHGVTLDMYYV